MKKKTVLVITIAVLSMVNFSKISVANTSEQNKNLKLAATAKAGGKAPQISVIKKSKAIDYKQYIKKTWVDKKGTTSFFNIGRLKK